MFYISTEQEITTDLLMKMISEFSSEVQPKIKKMDDYYSGKHKILKKKYGYTNNEGKFIEDKSKPVNHVVTNFCKVVCDEYSGYIVGKPVSYTSDMEIGDIQEVLNLNDTVAEDMEFCEDALKYGVAYELCWIDENADIRFKTVSPLNAFPIYDNSLDKKLIGFCRYYDIDSLDDSEIVHVELYTADQVTIYRANGFTSALQMIEQKPHYFGDVPVSVFDLNKDNESIFAQIITLNDAYNSLQSASIDDFEAWCDAYLCLIGVDATDEDIQMMKYKRTVSLPVDSDAKYITKNASDTQVQNLLENIKKNIYKISSCPDMGDENFLAQSGTALAWKIIGFESAASAIVARFSKALKRRIMLVCNILNLKASDAIWRDVDVNFVRNLPVNITEKIQLVQGLQGIVSDETLLSQLDFITDPAEEVERVRKQKEENMSVFSFTHTAPKEEAEEEEAE